MGDASLVHSVSSHHLLKSLKIRGIKRDVKNCWARTQHVGNNLRSITGTHSPESDSLHDGWRNRFDEQIRVVIAEYLERVEKENAIFHRRQFPVI